MIYLSGVQSTTGSCRDSLNPISDCCPPGPSSLRWGSQKALGRTMQLYFVRLQRAQRASRGSC